jgi:hypothetical protein
MKRYISLAFASCIAMGLGAAVLTEATEAAQGRSSRQCRQDWRAQRTEKQLGLLASGFHFSNVELRVRPRQFAAPQRWRHISKASRVKTGGKNIKSLEFVPY